MRRRGIGNQAEREREREDRQSCPEVGGENERMSEQVRDEDEESRRGMTCAASDRQATAERERERERQDS